MGQKLSFSLFFLFFFAHFSLEFLSEKTLNFLDVNTMPWVCVICLCLWMFMQLWWWNNACMCNRAMNQMKVVWDRVNFGVWHQVFCVHFVYFIFHDCVVIMWHKLWQFVLLLYYYLVFMFTYLFSIWKLLYVSVIILIFLPLQNTFVCYIWLCMVLVSSQCLLCLFLMLSKREK